MFFFFLFIHGVATAGGGGVMQMRAREQVQTVIIRFGIIVAFLTLADRRSAENTAPSIRVYRRALADNMRIVLPWQSK